jgi:hypothetical protein
MKEVLLIDCGNYNSVTTVQINYIKCLLKYGFKITYIIFKDGNQLDDIKFQRWPLHNNLTYKEVNLESVFVKIITKIFGKTLINYFLIKKFLNQYNHAVCFEFYSAAPVFIHSYLNKDFSYQIASLELYNTNSQVIKKAFQNAILITTQDELRKEQIVNYYRLPDSSKVRILYNTSLSFEEISTEKIEVPEVINNQKKILFIGSLISEHCIEDVIDCIEEMPNSFCIIFHGWGLSINNKKNIDKLQKIYPHKVWLSNIILNEQDKWKMYNIADFGVVMFNKMHRNNEYAGLSAGKLFDFIRVGVPVLVSDTKLLSHFVEKHSLGITVKEKISIHLKKETLNLNHFNNGLDKFSTISFDIGFKEVIKAI